MVWINDSEFTHASICIARRDKYGYIDRLIRLLDYRNDLNGIGSYTWAYHTDNQVTRTPEDPQKLYRPETLDSFHESGEDFLFVKWKPNYDNPERPWLLDPYTNPYGAVPNLYEVINSPANNIQELRNNLINGWPYSGTPTQQILMPYTGTKGTLDAILLNRDDLDYSNNRIRLKGSAPFQAEQYVINSYDIKYLPLDYAERTIYIKPYLPKPQGKALVKPLSQYAVQYMQWYVNAMHISESDQQRLVSMINDAFQAPERLDEFNTRLSSAEIHQLRKAIARFANTNNQMLALVKSTLEYDTNFKRVCIDECREEALHDLDLEREKRQIQLKEDLDRQKKDFDQQIQQQNDEISRLEDRVRARSESYTRLQNMVEPLEKKIGHLKQELETAQSAVEQANKQKMQKLEELEQQRQAALDQLDKDVALKLGLRSVVQSVISAQGASRPTDAGSNSSSSPVIQSVAYPSLPTTQCQADFVHTTATNLQSFGVMSTKNNSQAPIMLAKVCGRVLSVTRLIAVDSTFAAPLANALSYAGSGKPAKHISIPADWHDAATLDCLLTDEDTDVLVLDGPFDTINENLLFALSRLENDVTVILPIGAYGNLRLIAGEIWDHVFYLPTEQYVKLPVSPHQMLRSSETRKLSSPSKQAILGALTRLRAKTADDMTLASLVLPAALATQFSTTEEGESWTAAHLTLRTYAHLGMKPASTSSDGNTAAEMLLTRIERGRHDR
ncbi:hypothetical protein [Bifidobacterium biavatii]|uniref:Viral A-type inclusion protein repeat-containing protein n=1 Tax=Bifidobacterium biavatii DSM 23969 TaxID=1437608 RepID=A0A087A0C3_9BIFI|nr:hypothetical protein [Bifidobacterium biavatii]KFI52223.1 Viral A-type inclusion protein repeat-containing protein [Bifidobacterium biavatii DSM 23969]